MPITSEAAARRTCEKSPCGLRSALFLNGALNVFLKERIHVNRFDLLTHLEFVSKRRHTHTHTHTLGGETGHPIFVVMETPIHASHEAVI